MVAVISGRPASFLLDRVAPVTGAAQPDGLSSVHLVGLYGLERAEGDGEVTVEPGAERWRAVVDEATARLRVAAPPGVEVEPKGLALTVHWRRSPESAGRMQAVVEAEAADTGLRSHGGRMSIELRPPTDTDKGSVVRSVAGCAAACYLGDDLGDLPAFAALADLARTGGLAAASIGGGDDEVHPRWPRRPTWWWRARPAPSPPCVGWPTPCPRPGGSEGGRRARAGARRGVSRPRPAGRSTSRRAGGPR